jgi:8-oxo-dGTP pyrophosphatase MutT (NUDIX family)
VVERDGRFLMVEEEVDGAVVYNQPAGHLDDGESLLAAVARETREETGWQFEPQWLVGLYRWRSPAAGTTFLRVCFAGHCLHHDATRPLDEGILAAPWLSREELLREPARLRSPMVLRCIDDYLAQRRYPLDLLVDLEDLPWP